MENIQAVRSNGIAGAHRFSQHAFDEMRRAVTDTVERGSKMVKTLETAVRAKPYLSGAIAVAVASVAVGVGALFVLRSGRRRTVAYRIDRFIGDVVETAIRSVKTAI
jgi:hypothetical protein